MSPKIAPGLRNPFGEVRGEARAECIAPDSAHRGMSEEGAAPTDGHFMTTNLALVSGGNLIGGRR